MGVGKESDIYLVTSPSPAPANAAGNGEGEGLTPSTSPKDKENVQSILKIHRLGRISFRSLARNRDYHRNRQHATWQYLSRLSAQKEFAAMKALYAAGFPVPRPIGWNRHTVVMSLVPGMPLRQVSAESFGVVKESREEKIAALYDAIMELALRLAEVGCIHGDFNEFNILVENVPELGEPDVTEPEDADTETSGANRRLAPDQSLEKPLIAHLIDFPQITSISHPQARSYFDRDVDCIREFFRKKYGFETEDIGPTFEDAMERLREAEQKRAEMDPGTDLDEERQQPNHGKRSGTNRRLDVQIEAAGFSKKMAKELEMYYEEERQQGGREEAANEVGDNDVDDVDGDEPTEEGNAEDEGDATDRERVQGTDVMRGSADEVPQRSLTQDHLGSCKETRSVEDQMSTKMAHVSMISKRPTSKPFAAPKAVAGWAI